MSVHVQTWSGSGTARVTDMTNAGKRGKKCATLWLSGTSEAHYYIEDEAAKAAARLTADAFRLLEAFDPTNPFGMLRDRLMDLKDDARLLGVPEGWFALYDEEVRGVDAPRVKLTAGVEGLWSAHADEDGIHIRDLRDVNEWQEITPSSQSGARAYELAAKVWDKVKAAAGRREASLILEAAGCKLHGYCGLD